MKTTENLLIEYIDIKYGIFSVGNMFFSTLEEAISFCNEKYRLTDAVYKWKAIYRYAY